MTDETIAPSKGAKATTAVEALASQRGEALSPEMREELAEILSHYRGQRGAIIPVLQAVQGKFGYLSEPVLGEVGKSLRMTVNDIFGILTFYAQFRTKPSGKNVVRVCQGTACHVRGGRRILETVQQELGIQPGGTTEDYKFSLDRVACFGSCALAPVMVVNKDVYGRMTTTKARQILSSVEGEGRQ